MKKSTLFTGVLFAVLFLAGSGCAQFRELFSDSGAEVSRAERKRLRKKKSESEYKSRRYNRDPLDALLFTDRKKSENWQKNSNLTEAEQRAAGYALTPEDDVTRREIDRVYYESEKKRRKRQDEVFGPSPFRD